MIRQDIFPKRIGTGRAEYMGMKIVTAVFVFNMLRFGISEEESASIYDILFGPSNFFEITFGEAVVCFACGEERPCHCNIYEVHPPSTLLKKSDYHKSQCSISKDKLQYLIDNLPK